MTAETAIFTCSICSEPSSQICVYCTKDVCGNHRCERCKRCSDCCGCDVPLSAAEPEPPQAVITESATPVQPQDEPATAEASPEPVEPTQPGFGDSFLP